MAKRVETYRAANRVAALVCRHPGIHFEDAVARVVADAQPSGVDIDAIRAVAWDRVTEHWAAVV